MTLAEKISYVSAGIYDELKRGKVNYVYGIRPLARSLISYKEVEAMSDGEKLFMLKEDEVLVAVYADDGVVTFREYLKTYDPVFWNNYRVFV